MRLCDFGSCVIGHTPLRNVSDRNAAEEIIQQETTQMYRAPEMIDLYLRDVLTEKTDIWVRRYAHVFVVQFCHNNFALRRVGIGMHSVRFVLSHSSISRRW